MEIKFKNSAYKERHVFVGKLKSQPIFLLQHLRSVTKIVWDRYKMQCFSLLRGKHLHTKQRPIWLKSFNTLRHNQCKTLQEVLFAIPDRHLAPTPLPEILFCSTRTPHQATHSDPEDYLATLRWNNLIAELITAANDNQSSQSLHLPTPIYEWLQNPHPKNDAAWETYSSCERVANLLTWISFIPMERRLEVLPQATFSFLEDSMQWIFNHLEFYGPKTNNHILNNARTLILLGTVLKNPTAIKVGMTIFQHMLPILIQPQGALREHSTHYQLIILTWLLDALRFAQASKVCDNNDLEFLDATTKRVREVAAAFCDKTGYLQAQIGDISPDAIPLLTAQRLLLCYSEWWPCISMVPSHQYDNWHILENKQHKVLLNCPAGQYPKQHAAHAHNDILSFVWLYDEYPILIDSGRARYTKEAIPIQQKSAFGHNMPLVNGMAPLCESLLLAGNWWPLPYANASIHLQAQTNQQLVIEHDGFKRATPVTHHARHISLNDKTLNITDKFSGEGKVVITLLWQLHPSFTQFNRDGLTIHNGLISVQMQMSKTKEIPEIQFETDQNQHCGWYSTHYGHAQPHPMLKFIWEVTLPFQTEIEFKATSCVE